VNRTSIALALENLLEFLTNDSAPLIPRESLQRFAQRTRDLLDKARQPGEVLYVGILGGTGVGKSTLINALASEKISDVADRRPFTDRAVVYRHRDTPRGLEKVAGLLRERDALHDVPVIRDLILLDLPDFDSAAESNRLAVLEIINFLDSIVWVVSPEKYADEAFYHMVRTAALRKENFVFVFNKADELMETGRAGPHDRIKEILGDLTFRLKHEAGVDEPRIFTLSAEDQFLGRNGDPVLASEFSRFRDFLMARRETKEIASIKTANLKEKVSRLMSDLDSEIRPAETSEALRAVATIDTEPNGTDKRFDLQRLDQVKVVADAVKPRLLRADASVVPVKSIMRVLTARWTAANRGSANSVEETFALAAERLAAERRARLESVSARVKSELLLGLRGNEAAVAARHAGDPVSQAIDQASASLAAAVESKEKALSGGFSKWRRVWQKAILSLPWVVFVLRLCGEQRLETWLDHPSPWGLGKLVVSVLTGLFSSEGLTGLLVLLVFEAILVYFLASRRIRKIEGQCQALARTAISDLETGLDAAMDEIKASRNRVLATMEASLRQFERIHSRFLHTQAGYRDASGP